MITENTVFILGAGASKPYGFPTAWELKLDIISNFSNRILNILSRASDYPSGYDIKVKEFVNRFRDSRNISIDLFLSRNPEFSDLGKEAIVLSLLEYESRSGKYWFKEDIVDDWYISIFNYMLEDLSHPKGYLKFGDNNITFITYNYDRSLEHYLYNAFLNSYAGVQSEEIKSIFNKINIYHIYGKLGDLFWQIGEGNSSETFLNYGKTDISYSNLEVYRKSIRTIPERKPIIQDSPIFKSIAEAKKMIFLGFSFADENMDILKEAIKYFRRGQLIYATTMDLSERRINYIRKKYFMETTDGAQYPRPESNFRPEPIDSNALLIKYLL